MTDENKDNEKGVRSEIVVLSADEPNSRTIGWVINETLGVACISKSVLNKMLGYKKVIESLF